MFRCIMRCSKLSKLKNWNTDEVIVGFARPLIRLYNLNQVQMNRLLLKRTGWC